MSAPNAQANTDGMANLVFFSSLSDLKEWSLFELAKGANINTMTSAALFAEVKTYDATLKHPKTSSEITPSDQVKALDSNIYSQQGSSNRGNYHGGGSNHSGKSENRGGKKKGGNSRGGKKGYNRNPDFDPNKYCMDA